ncbi:MAG TPA: Shedu anti-phage system protein SduA domain-containing protein, partial [Longimicrobium sp.]|nr:Shedu anti-phage system protein SduA domain-containing protein [Longimicrobium sp.]
GYHGPLFDAVFSQPELPGFRAKRPDFLLFEQDSARIYAVLIEIEAPAKRWTTNNGTPHSDLIKALDQIRDWKTWFSEPRNVLAFRDLYKIDPEWLDTRTLVQHFVLIYGRRDEATAIESFAKKRGTYAHPDEFLMTYDRLLPNGSVQYTVKLDRSGPDTKIRLVSVPPTFSLDRSNAERFTSFIGQEEAILNQPIISVERRDFLLRRFKSAQRFYKEKRKGQESEIPWWEW